MKALIDTSIALDLLQDRKPFVYDALTIFALAEDGQAKLYLSADAVSTIFYIVAKDTSRSNAHAAIDALLGFVHIAMLDETMVRHANTSAIDDLEDALVAEAARSAKVDALVTRDCSEFRKAGMPVLSPAEFIATVKAN